MGLIELFEGLSKNDAGSAGGKGASLGEMTQAGIPVPPGFVVLTSAYDRFLAERELHEEIQAELDRVNHQELETVERASERIRGLILNAEMPEDIATEITGAFATLGAEFVAVRSSATAEDGAGASWAGELDSFLNTTSETLLQNVRRCWASLFTPRAIFYRFEQGFGSGVAVAVVVQKMVQSDVSGIAFSVHPVTEDPNQLIIEAGWGLGEAIVSGSVTPDNYVVDKRDWSVVDTYVASQERALHRVGGSGGIEWSPVNLEDQERQKLSDEKVNELARLVVRIEQHYGFPCDIEWAMEGEELFIVQSRPITTLSTTVVPPKNVVEKFIDMIGDKKIISFDSRMLPFTIFFDWPRYYDREGTSHEVKPILLHMMPDGLTKGYMDDSEYCMAAEEGLRAHLQDEDYIPRVQRRYEKITTFIGEEYERFFGSQPELSEQEQFGLVERLYRALIEIVTLTLPIERLDKAISQSVVARSINLEKIWPISELCIFESFESRDSKYILQVLDTSENIDLLRYVYTGYTFLPTRKDVEDKIAGIDREQLRKQIEESEKSIRDNKRKRETLLRDLSDEEQYVLRYIDWVMETRDDRKGYISKSEIQMAVLSQKLFALWGLDPDLVQYTSLLELLRGKEYVVSIKENLETRKNGYTIFYPGDGQAVEQASEDVSADIARLEDVVVKQHLDGQTDRLIGETGSRGQAKGVVKVVLATHEFDKFEDGDILVAPMTRPEYVPLMRRAKAIITDEGGITCHAAIVSRELGIPCVIGTKIATRILKDGDQVEVDATQGIVLILENTKTGGGSGRVLQTVRSMKWERWLERPFHAFVYSLFEDSYRKESFEEIGIPGIDSRPQLAQKSFWYFNPEEMAKMDTQVGAFLGSHHMSDITALLSRFRENSEDEIKNLLSGAEPIERRFEKVFGILRGACTFIWLAHGVESYYDRVLQEEVPKYIHDDIDTFIGDASFPRKKNASARLEQLMRTDMPSADIAREMGWVKIRDGFSDPFTADEIDQMRGELGPAKEFPDVVIPEELKLLFEQVSELVFFRTERTDVFYQLFYQARPILRVLAEKYGIDFDDLKYYRAKSFIDGKAERYAPACSFAFDGKDVVFQDDPIIDDSDSEGEKISGKTAYEGTVKGVVRIVKDTKELDKVGIGDILVTQMTFPSFVPAMHRAAAFVTDEGGITCHAAIIARELQKPCIIGTKNATKVLRDGDLVEVNATQGIVTRIEETKGRDAAPKAWYYWGCWKGPILYNSPWLPSVETDIFERMGLAALRGDAFHLDGHFFTLQEDMDTMRPRVVESLHEEGGWFEELLQLCQEQTERMQSLEDSGDVAGFIRQWQEIAASSLLVQLSDLCIQDSLHELCRESGVSFEEFAASIQPARPTPLIEYNTEITHVTEETVEKFVRKYRWVGAQFFTGTPLTVEQALVESSAASKKVLEPSVASKVPEWPDSLRRVAWICSELLFHRSNLYEVANQVAVSFWSAFQDIAKRVGSTLEELNNLTHWEVLKLWEGGGLPDDVSHRSDAYGLEYCRGSLRVIGGEKLRKKLDELMPRDESSGEVKGMVAYKGVVRGVVRVVNTAKELAKVLDGDILVAPETTPDYVVAMKRASAFVTNQGGITSHAAIIARELKKPCIIGTKNATTALKDGDFVEVNAIEGVVKLISQDAVIKEGSDIKGIDQEWQKSSVRRMSYQKMRLYHNGWVRGYKDIFDYTQHFTLNRVKDGNVTTYLSKKEVEGQSSLVFQKFTDTEFIQTKLAVLGEEMKRDFDGYVSFAKSLPRDWKPLSNEELLKYVEEFYRADESVEMYYWILFNTIELVLDKAVRHLMQAKGYDHDQIDEAISVTSQSLLITPLDMERQSILRVALSSDKENALQTHWQEYAFLPVYDIDYDPYDLEHFRKELEDVESHLLSEEITRNIDEITEKYKKRRTEFEDTLRKLKPDKDLNILLSFLSDFASLKDRKPYVRDQGSYYIRGLFEEVAQRTGLSLLQVLYLTEPELEDAIRNGKTVPSEILDARIRDSVFLCEDTSVHIYTDPEEVRRIDESVTVKETVRTLKGLSVSPGKAKGKVAVVISNADFSKFQEGDVLVASSTRPDYVPLMKKAAAILTDEGGMLSHAALVSRELHLPCVVNLKTASQVLKDGDVVEVDASEGVVTIIDGATLSTPQDYLQRDRYFSTGRWVCPVLEYETWLDWSRTPEARDLGYTEDERSIMGIDGYFYVPAEGAYSAIRMNALNEFREGKTSVAESLIACAETLCEACDTEVREIVEKPGYGDFLRGFSLLQRLAFPRMACFAIGEAGEDYLKEYAERHGLTLEDLVAAMPHLSNSITDDQKQLMRFRRELEEKGLAGDIDEIRASDADLADRLERYRRDTEFLGTHHFWGQPRTMERLLGAVRSATEQEGEEKSTGDYPDLGSVLYVLGQAARWRLEGAHLSDKLAFAYRPYITSLALDNGLAYEECLYLTTDEIALLSAGNLANAKTIAKERQPHFGMYSVHGKYRVFTGSELDSVKKNFELLEEETDRMEEIKGKTGNKGRVLGEVAILLTPQDSDKIRPGMILVAPETTPDFVPAMNQAAAFVTDQGGITSHAAIVAREMGKPCIIGTKVATRVLKDGDTVEVDATNGTVRILTR